jgi:hypothetical protein
MLHLPFVLHQNRDKLVLGSLWRFPISPLFRVTASARTHRLIYVDPARTDYVIPFNVLATQVEHPCDIAAAVLKAFRCTWPECLKEAPHFSNVVTTALIVLYELHEVRIGQPKGDTADAEQPFKCQFG